MTIVSRFLFTFGLLAALSGVSAADVTIDALVTPSTVALGQIPNTRNITVGKFDPALGPLKSVQISMTIQLAGAMGAENQSLQSGTTNVSLIYSAGVFLYPSSMAPPTPAAIPPAGTAPGVYRTDLPSGGLALGSTIAQVSVAPSLASFDGVLDYAGTSGATFSIGPAGTGLTGSYSSTLFAPVDLATFTGPAGAPGDLSYIFSSSGATNGTGTGGNMTFFYNGLVGSNIRVQYTFVPEPASWLLLALGLTAPLMIRGNHRRRLVSRATCRVSKEGP